MKTYEEIIRILGYRMWNRGVSTNVTPQEIEGLELVAIIYDVKVSRVRSDALVALIKISEVMEEA